MASVAPTAPPGTTLTLTAMLSLSKEQPQDGPMGLGHISMCNHTESFAGGSA